MRRLVVRLIRLYQQTLSPDHGWARASHPHGVCRYSPTCSEYTALAVARYGVVGGLWLGFRRIIRCHPWAIGGADPVPMADHRSSACVIATADVQAQSMSTTP